MKNVVTVVVFNRFNNLKRWVHCWQQCEQKGAELRIIHNYASLEDLETYKQYCIDNNIVYVSRKNVGMDIGAFQDVCKERLAGFDNNWSNLLWVTDDTIPMSKDFVNTYLRNMTEENVGVACMEISNEVRRHVRTTGFCIKKEITKKLQFLVDPITTKEHCYQFEHRHPTLNLLTQVAKLGYKSVQINPLQTSVLWDTGNRAHFKRMKEHEFVFYSSKEQDKVIFISLIHNSYPYLIHSLQAQTHKNWELLLIHDGKNTTNLKETIEKINDSRVIYLETEENKGNWGHYWRNWALEQINKDVYGKSCNYVVVTNADNQHVPGYTENLLKGFVNDNTVASYCSSMVHNYINWGIIPCKLERGYIDSACVMVKKEIACEIGWKDVTSHSSDWTYFNDIIKKYGANNFKKVEGCLLIHN